MPTSPEFLTPSVGLFTRDVVGLARFYEALGFAETYRYPREGAPDHIELRLDGLTLAISSVEAATRVHGLHPELGGRPAYVLVWTHDTDAAYARLTANGAPSVRPPEDFLSHLRTAWVADPDGNPVNLVQRKGDPSGR